MFLGNDLVYIPRIERLLERYGDSFLNRVLTCAEQAYCAAQAKKNKPFANMVAARVAVKEAASKALGVGLNGLGYGQGVNWCEIEIQSEVNQPPKLVFYGHALKVAETLKSPCWAVSWSHDKQYAMAVVVGQ